MNSLLTVILTFEKNYKTKKQKLQPYYYKKVVDSVSLNLTCLMQFTRLINLPTSSFFHKEFLQLTTKLVETTNVILPHSY